MEILLTLGQVPLMFIGGFLIVVAVAAVGLFVQAQRKSFSTSRAAFRPDNPDTP